MRYLLDTTTLIDFSKGREPVTSRILEMIELGDEVGVCAINVAEFHSGLPIGVNASLDEFILSLKYWDISRASASRAGSFRYSCARKGKSVSTADALIAYTAFEVGAILVTDNIKDYPEELETVSLRKK